MMSKKWEYYQIDEALIYEIAKNNNISTLLAKILLNRGIDTNEKIEKFLHPKIEYLYDPYLLCDMEKAINRIIDAINKKQKITVYGDYDVDGITSIAVLTKFLTELGVENTYYLPNRLDEGYGLNKSAIKTISENDTSLLITVDCGISANDEVEYANSIGLDVIITDHHECLKTLPNAVAVIDPKREDSEYPFKYLAGVGVTFKLIQAISIRLGLDRAKYLKYLDIVCLGTVADIVPLVDENRVIVKFGLELIKQTKNQGLKALIKAAGYDKIDSTAISFGLAPRINACGRMGEAQIALKLLLTNLENEAIQIADELNKINRERQSVERRIMEEAISLIKNNELYKDNVIILGNTDWHHGVIGIVASKITEMYYKPSILICFEGEEGKGSGRSIEGFDLHEALGGCSDSLIKYGGHEMAIGLSIESKKFDDFKKMLLEIAGQRITEDMVATIKVDSEVTTKDISLDMVKSLELLEPYGEGNLPPVFIYKNIKVDSIRTLSEDKHLKLNVKDGNIIFDAIGFNMGELKDSIKMGDRVDILHYLEINKYNNTERVQLNIKDIKHSL
jgi:single-stranded-DNA-specific exonuclease